MFQFHSHNHAPKWEINCDISSNIPYFFNNKFIFKEIINKTPIFVTWFITQICF